MEKGIRRRRYHQVRVLTSCRINAYLNHIRNFDFKEKLEVNKYYPQYYHKTDKV